MTLSILNKNSFDTLNINKSNQIHEENFNRLSREGRIYDTFLFNTKWQLRHFLYQSNKSTKTTLLKRDLEIKTIDDTLNTIDNLIQNKKYKHAVNRNRNP